MVLHFTSDAADPAQKSKQKSKQTADKTDLQQLGTLEVPRESELPGTPDWLSSVDW